MKYQILQGDNRLTLKTLADNSIDAIVTDPPYGIDFLGKGWDANTGALETYQECLRVLKPGGHILAFSAARTYHHLAVTLEQAGFEIRDQIMWIYSSGFPKSQDIGKSIQRSMGVKEYDGFVDTTKNSGFGQMDVARQKVGQEWSTKETQVGKAKVTDPEALEWLGWGTALKPAHEPIALARKPLHKSNSIARNCQQWGVGALNIDATRIATDDVIICGAGNTNTFNNFNAENNVDGPGTGVKINKDVPKWSQAEGGRFPSNVLGEILQADYQKYFYCPKVSRKERHVGFEDPGAQTRRARDEDGNVLGYAEKKPGASATMLAEQFQLNDTGIVSRTEMIERMGGYWANEQGQPKQPGEDSKMCWTPDTGLIFAHGITQDYATWCKKNSKSTGNMGNNHPTVKPIELMKYLIKLITPPGGIVLDPFNGSGSTGCAAVELGFEYIGCELDPAYVEITKTRIEAWNKQDTNFEALFSAA